MTEVRRPDEMLLGRVAAGLVWHHRTVAGDGPHASYYRYHDETIDGEPLPPPLQRALARLLAAHRVVHPTLPANFGAAAGPYRVHPDGTEVSGESA